MPPRGAIELAVGATLLLPAGCTTGQPLGAAPVEVQIPALAAPVKDDPAPLAPPSRPAIVAGRYEGVGRQTSGASWDIIVDLESVDAGVCAHVRYPTVPCAAEWICQGTFDGRVLHAVEHVTEGKDACIDGGAMTIAPTSGGALDWRWISDDEKASAHLRRVGPPGDPH